MHNWFVARFQFFSLIDSILKSKFSLISTTSYNIQYIIIRLTTKMESNEPKRGHGRPKGEISWNEKRDIRRAIAREASEERPKKSLSWNEKRNIARALAKEEKRKRKEEAKMPKGRPSVGYTERKEKRKEEMRQKLLQIEENRVAKREAKLRKKDMAKRGVSIF